MNIILLNIDDIKSINNNAFYKVHAGISIADSALKILINKEINDNINLLWDFIKIAFTNEHNTYSKSLYDSFFKACDKMNDLELKEKVEKEMKN